MNDALSKDSVAYGFRAISWLAILTILFAFCVAPTPTLAVMPPASRTVRRVTPAMRAAPEYRLVPLRVTFGSAPLSLPQLIEQDAQASGVSLNLEGATFSSSNNAVASVNTSGLLSFLKVGVATVTTQLSQNQGSVSVLVNVLPVKLTNNSEAAIAPIPNQTYTGSPIKPTLIVTCGATTLRLGIDYTVSYIKNVAVGTATAIANGKGNYTGYVSTTFTIVQPSNTPGSGESTPTPDTPTPDTPTPDTPTPDTPTPDKPTPDTPTPDKPTPDTPTPDTPTPDTPTPDKPTPDTPTPDTPTPDTPTPDTPTPPVFVRVLRLYNPNSGWHLFTASTNEYDYLSRIGWSPEGTAWYSPLEGPSIYRLYNPNTGWHFFTENRHERDYLVQIGWQGEGVAFHSAPDTGHPIYRLYNPNTGWHLFTESLNEYTVLQRVGWSGEGIAWYGERVGSATVG